MTDAQRLAAVLEMLRCAVEAGDARADVLLSDLNRRPTVYETVGASSNFTDLRGVCRRLPFWACGPEEMSDDER